ncbi:hypothetical protein [Flavobacterium daemonense]|uniref:hypothetical protein n=1 Tax=Flavobacterium daemonense TaxID=1393049 RepID=UPI001187078F|nr:hypothetical protein [Flavobacterium daemonense]KAF2333763.1 hypothetical protein FND99_09850 [Flavobacterium daemonense]
MIKKITSIVIILFLISCKGQEKNKIIDSKKGTFSKKEACINNSNEIYIGKVFFEGDELNDYEWIKSDKIKNVDSLSYSIYQNKQTKYYIISIEKNLKNEDVEKFKIIDTLNIKNCVSSDLKIKENILTSKIEVNVFCKSKIVKTWGFKSVNVNESQIPSNWLGNYHMNINEESKDWREIKSISVSITKDSIVYEAAGYQLFERYLLKIKKNNNAINLSFDKIINGSQNAVLEKTKDFGEILYDGKNYNWICPYIDISFMNGKKNKYVLKKNNF